MRILVISDIHANLNALEAVLDHAGDFDAAWCLGDLVGYGPDPNECVERVRALPNLVCVLGNHDAAAIDRIDLTAFNREARQSVHWMQKALTNETVDFLHALPEMQIAGEVTLTHGSPRNSVWEYLLDPYTAAINFGYFNTRICLVGHTHLPITFQMSDGTDALEWRLMLDDQNVQIAERAILNPGSVGQPRDHDPRASYAIFNTDPYTWENHRVAYDIQDVQDRIYNSGLPHRFAIRLTDGW